MNLQYQLSNGNWLDCNGGYDGKQRDRTEEFLALCAKNSNMTIDEARAALLAGKTLRNDPADWYSKCRVKPEPRPVAAVEIVRCSCGHSIPRAQVMSASMGTACPRCYDRMSD